VARPIGPGTYGDFAASIDDGNAGYAAKFDAEYVERLPDHLY
jgi:hypothetical protein